MIHFHQGYQLIQMFQLILRQLIDYILVLHRQHLQYHQYFHQHHQNRQLRQLLHLHLRAIHNLIGG